ncbi:glycosyltransferase family 2 protein [Chitinophaga deserti]|uniref:glycosyltransferase family 2 protein n=1 Tax=Chitinophaga deserti TaxID=2164099 RepID=UPI000D6ADBE0|nr:glycosyltransferase family 2 protein [Chitinophaga deserti]
MEKKAFTVGLLISTYNWPRALDAVLKSAMRQTRMPDEIIIADDGSGVATEAIIRKYATLMGIPFRHAWHEDDGFRKSLILNKAVKLSESDYIIEVDGDIVMHPKFVEDHIRHAQKGIFIQGARTMVQENRTTRILNTGSFDPINFFSLGIGNRFNSLRIPFLSWIFKLSKQDATKTRGCNLAFWKDDFIKVNGYNNTFSGWGSEDNEFAARLINAGIKKVRLKWSANCYHLHHNCNSKSEVEANEYRYMETIRYNLISCMNGYAEV